MSIYVGNKDIKNLFVGASIKDYSAIKGPAPDGFHVPLNTEWQGLKTIMDGLSLTTGDSWRINLHIPFAGRRHYNNAAINNQSSNCYCWSSSSYGSSGSTTASRLNLTSSTVNISGGNSRVLGYSIRCFKDSYVAPTSSWTVIKGTLGSAGIFWNQSDGLISITSNGTTGYTIQDKNLGATTVYNDGDTLTQANMGNMYQWGNNYGFPSTGTIGKKSSTQVNASNYGPGNYYSSSTFITVNGDWSSVHNDNLRGGVTGIAEKKAEAKAVYLGSIKVRPIDTRTFTISWTEKSDMSSGWTYSDDAAGLTAGDTSFDEFFGYYGCRLNTSGQETATVTQAQSGGNGKLDITQLGTLTSGDNVMICFPKRGIKMSKNGTTVTLSITDDPNKTGYQYYAFTRNGTIMNKLYIGAYKATNSSNVLKSWSGTSAINSMSLDNVTAYAKANSASYNPANSNYDEITWYIRNYINALYVLKYGNPDSQSKIGMGNVGGSFIKATGGTNSITDATGATDTSNTGRIKIFGLEDWWGNVFEWLDGAYYSSSTRLQVSKAQAFASSGKMTSYDTNITVVNGWMSSAVATNEGMFASNKSNGSESTYYCDYFSTNYGSWLLASGARYGATSVGAFYMNSDAASTAGAYYGGRLIYL